MTRMTYQTAGACLLLLGGLPGRAADQADWANQFIRPVPHKAWGDSPEGVKKVLTSAAVELSRHFAKLPTKPILVEVKGGPISLFERGPGGEYIVRLDTDDSLWAQWVYQFSHELGHILSNYDEVSHKNKWFEETICEVASLYVLRRLAVTWSQDPSPGYWKRYAPAMRRYAEDRISKARLPDDKPLADWYAACARDLARTGYDREKNTIAAVHLLPLFEESPEHWAAIASLAQAKKGHDESFPQFLKAWQGHCPEMHRPFVAKLARRFGIDLDQVQLTPPKDARNRNGQ